MDSRAARILIAEDNEADVFLVKASLEEAGFAFDLHVASDGEEVLRLVERVDGDGDGAWCPEIVILDLNLPRYSGEEILDRFHHSARLRAVPVIVFTSSDSPKDRANVAKLGVTEYFRKPQHFEEFMELGKIVRRLLDRDANPS
jgi:DNA-binding response OmpR family regulator